MVVFWLLGMSRIDVDFVRILFKYLYRCYCKLRSKKMKVVNKNDGRVLLDLVVREIFFEKVIFMGRIKG